MNCKLLLIKLLSFTLLAQFSMINLGYASTDESAIQLATFKILGTNTNLSQDKMLKIWLSPKTIAVSVVGGNEIGIWQNWQAKMPTFFHAYNEVGYRIEFDSLEGGKHNRILASIKPLLTSSTFVEQVQIGGRIFKRVALRKGLEVAKQMASWEQFVTYDYADIGDNETDKVLGKLINQGFSLKL